MPPSNVHKYVYLIGHSNTKYKIDGIVYLSDTLYIFTEVNHDFNTQPLKSISGLLTPNFACNVQSYFKDGKLKSTCQSQNALPATDSDT